MINRREFLEGAVAAAIVSQVGLISESKAVSEPVDYKYFDVRIDFATPPDTFVGYEVWQGDRLLGVAQNRCVYIQNIYMNEKDPIRIIPCVKVKSAQITEIGYKVQDDLSVTKIWKQAISEPIDLRIENG